MACSILVPGLGIKLAPPAIETLNWVLTNRLPGKPQEALIIRIKILLRENKLRNPKRSQLPWLSSKEKEKVERKPAMLRVPELSRKGALSGKRDKQEYQLLYLLDQWSPDFLAQGLVSWKTTFPRTRVVGEWFQDDSSTSHLLCLLFLLLLMVVSSTIRSQRLETPVLGDSWFPVSVSWFRISASILPSDTSYWPLFLEHRAHNVTFISASVMILHPLDSSNFQERHKSLP